MLILLLIFFVSSVEIRQNKAMGEDIGGLGDLGHNILETVTCHHPSTAVLGAVLLRPHN